MGRGRSVFYYDSANTSWKQLTRLNSTLKCSQVALKVSWIVVMMVMVAGLVLIM